MIRAIFHLILLLAVAAALTAWDARRQLAAPLQLDSEQTLSVARGTAWSRLVVDLQARGWLEPRAALYLKAFGRLSGDASRIQAGEYAVQPGTTPVELLALLKSGDVISYQLTLVEGWRTDQAWAAVRAHPKIKRTDGLDDPVALMQALGKAEQHPEGRFLPETYRFTQQTSDVEFMRRAYVAMEAAMARQWAARQPDLPLANADEALILASIIERETGVPAERPQIAGVFVRRLRLGMRLQTDPTVIYGMGEAFDGNIRRRDLRTDTPYNTYTRKGLPPTPIALPGEAALAAAVNPEDGDSLFFVSRGDGSHVFSATVQEHNAAVRKYQLKR